MIWKQHKEFSPEFLAEHHEFIVYDTYNQIKALLLFPPKCSCSKLCKCSKWRKKITLSLNTKLYNKALKAYEKPERLRAMKTLWALPESHSFRALYPDSYPIWIIEKELKAREEADHFKIIDQLVWTFLRVGKTSEAYIRGPEASVNEAFTLLKKAPQNTKLADLKQDERRCGKKEYEKQFKHYQSVCHFIAALEIWKKEEPKLESYLKGSLYLPLQLVERFLSLAHWFRKQLLSLKRPNVKENIFLREEDICPLPSWVQSDDIDFPIETFEEKVREMWAKAVIIDPEANTVTPAPYPFPSH